MNKRIRKKIREPLTSEEQYQRTRAEINKLNKDRARAMENRIAKYLRGSRVPMSGAAAQWKGDCIIPLINNPGMYLVECKLTARRTKESGKEVGNMLYELKWLTKLDAEVKAMNSKFGILVTHYHGYTGDFVWIKDDYIHKLLTQYTLVPDYILSLQQLLHTVDLIPDIKGNINLVFGLTNKQLLDTMKQYHMIKGLRIQLPTGCYIVMPIQDFRDMVWEI